MVNTESGDRRRAPRRAPGRAAEPPADPVRLDVLTRVFDIRARPKGSERRSIEILAALLSQSPGDFESRTELDLAPGSYEVRVGVAQRDSGLTGSVYGYVDVPSADAAGLDLSGVILQALPALRDVFGVRLIRSGGRCSYAASVGLRSYAAGLIRPAAECRRRWL